MLTKKLLALAALVLFATVAAVGLTRAADMPKAAKNCEAVIEGDSACPGSGTNLDQWRGEVPRTFEGQGTSE